jgi:hypothetical protein
MLPAGSVGYYGNYGGRLSIALHVEAVLHVEASQLHFRHLFFIIVTKIVLLCLVYYQIASYNQ